MNEGGGNMGGMGSNGKMMVKGAEMRDAVRAEQWMVPERGWGYHIEP